MSLNKDICVTQRFWSDKFWLNMELFPLISGNLGLTLQNSWWQKCCLSIGLLMSCESYAWRSLQPFVLLSSCQSHMHWPKCGSPSQKHPQCNSPMKSGLNDLKLGHQGLSALWLRKRQNTTRSLWLMESFPSLPYTISLYNFFTSLQSCTWNQADYLYPVLIL